MDLMVVENDFYLFDDEFIRKYKNLKLEKNSNVLEEIITICNKIYEKEYKKVIILTNKNVEIFNISVKQKGIVVANISDEHSAHMTIEHNNTNLLILDTDVLGIKIIKSIINNFLSSEYSGGRHNIRVDMLSELIK